MNVTIIISLLVLMASLFTLIGIIGYAAGFFGFIHDLNVKTKKVKNEEVKNKVIHSYGEDVNDIIELYEEVENDEGEKES